jgi:hypothetical protein
MTKVLITQSNYIPWKGYFDSINLVDIFIVYDDMQYTKRDWRNRNKLKTPQGLSWLSIPVTVKGKYLQKINETEVSDENWAKKHWKTICQYYTKAPFFNDFNNHFEEIYLNCDTNNLSDINISLIKAVNLILGVTTKIIKSSELGLIERKTERLVDLCKKVGGTEYYTGPAAKNYLDESFFLKEEIKVNYLNYSGYPEYHQLYGEFAHDVSILDLIFNEGDNASSYMKSF